MKLVRIFIICFFSITILAQDELSIIAVGEAEATREKVYFTDLYEGVSLTVKERQFLKSLYEQLINNFQFYKKFFEVIKSSEGYKSDNDFYSFKSTDWAKKEARFVVSIGVNSKKQMMIYGYDVGNKKILSNKEFSFQSYFQTIQKRKFVHDIADELYYNMTGKRSIFPSRIVFVSDVPSKKRKTIKELYIMDFDGKNTKRLTWHQGIVISPSINKTKDKVLYSLIRYSRGKRNVNLYMMDLKTAKSTLLSSRKGINSGAVFSNDGRSIYLTLSISGNAEIYQMNLGTKKIRRITRHSSDDVDPSITKDGETMAFLSGRAGKAMIYTMDPRGSEKNVKRISYVGQFNANPRFNPEGSEIAFSSWVDNRFDIYRINTEGTELVRLTKDFGSNESPSYSNDSQFIVFSSQRILSRKKAVQNLYIMDRDGEILGAITKNFGNCSTPRWSK